VGTKWSRTYPDYPESPPAGVPEGHEALGVGAAGVERIAGQASSSEESHGGSSSCARSITIGA
jgi:hypothetical protein